VVGRHEVESTPNPTAVSTRQQPQRSGKQLQMFVVRLVAWCHRSMKKSAKSQSTAGSAEGAAGGTEEGD
jgi:hypothetical protein